MTQDLNYAAVVIMPFATAILALIGLLIRNAILDSTLRLSNQINLVGNKIDMHVASDLEKHDALDKHLTFSDGRLDRLESKMFLAARKK